MTNNRVPPLEIAVLGESFQSFIDPSSNQPVFSYRGTARALNIPSMTVKRTITSKEFKALRGNESPCTKLSTTVSSMPISVITQSDLVILVKLLAAKGHSRAVSMQEASFAVLLQQSVDELLDVERSRRDYLEGGATLRQQLEYRYSYSTLQKSTFKKARGVGGLCRINLQVSSLAVKDANELRCKSKDWRKRCSGLAKVKLTIGNAVHQMAVDSSSSSDFDQKLDAAADRTTKIFDLLDKPF
jgi:hypothetical protein